jgi:DNA-binding NarL/FixJ family response regulator
MPKLESSRCLVELLGDITECGESSPQLAGRLGRASATARSTLARTAVIFHTSHADSSLVRAALDAGVRAVVLKDGSPANLLQAISAVAADSTYIDPRLSPSGRWDRR